MYRVFRTRFVTGRGPTLRAMMMIFFWGRESQGGRIETEKHQEKNQEGPVIFD